MSKIETISLTEDERSKLAGKLVEKGLTQEDLAQVIGKSQSSVAQKMRGKSPIRYEEAKIIYDFLNQDASLDFLVRYNQNEDFPSTDEPNNTGTEGMWDRLFQEYVQKLRSTYHDQNPEQKGSVISELEELTRKYS